MIQYKRYIWIAIIAVFFVILCFLLISPRTSHPNAPASSQADILAASDLIGLPLHHLYALIIDAGSTGTRIHVYEFLLSNPSKTSFNPSSIPTFTDVSKTLKGLQIQSLRNEIFYEIPQGLASFVSSSDTLISQLISPLIAVALKNIPESMYPITPLVLKATAGLRLLPENQQNTLLDTIRDYFTKLPFLFKHDWVSVISGNEEGLGGWLTVNFLLGNLKSINKQTSTPPHSSNNVPEHHSTAAIMDLGGASTQVVFELDPIDYFYIKYHKDQVCQAGDSLVNDLCNQLSQSITDLEYNGQKYHIFQQSFLGYGLMEARRKIKQNSVNLRNAMNGFSNAFNATSVEFPCFPPMYSETLAETTIQGTADSSRCHYFVKSIFNINAPCPVAPCAFDGIHFPRSSFTSGVATSMHVNSGNSATKSSPVSSLYAFSYFYDRLQPLFPALAYINLGDVISATEQVCNNNSGTGTGNKNSMVNAVVGHQCLDLTFIKTLLMDVYGLSTHHRINLVKKINGIETCWALGSALLLFHDLFNN